MDNFRGSTWAIWDLHIHTPKSIVNCYGGDTPEIWERFIHSLENLPPDVKVIGINDYYFIDGFEQVMKYKMEQGRLANIKKVFPILEFRIDTFATASESKFQKVNLHILFNINDDDWKNEIKTIRDEFISLIPITKLPEHATKMLSKQNLTDCSPDKSLQSGLENLIPSTDKVFELLGSNKWRHRTFTFLGFSEWNNLEKGKALKLFKNHLYDRANAFFTASIEDNLQKKQQVIEKFGDKILLHSMDIHDFECLSIDNYKCLTWIKADYTFEGLKQILFEPKERVKIQSNNPYLSETKTNVIDTVGIKNQTDWFEDKELPLNPGLVAIIGEKGAGKTALLDMIAIANREGIYEQDMKNPCSFYNRACNLIQDAVVEVKYAGTEQVSSFPLRGKYIKSSSDKHAKVRYLSLKELENYCDNNATLQGFIKDIIHSKSEDILNFDNDAKEIIKQINIINNSISNLESENDKIDEITNAINNKQSELDTHILNEPKITTVLTAEQEKYYKNLLIAEQNISKKLKQINAVKNDISDFYAWIEMEINNIKVNFEANLISKANSYQEIGEILRNKIGISINLEGIDYLNEYTEMQSIKEATLINALKNVEKNMKPLKDLHTSIEEEQKALKNWLSKKSELESELKNLQFEREKIEKNNSQIQELTRLRRKYYEQLINIKAKQKRKYEELKNQFEGEENIKFEVKIIFNKEKFLERENDLINHISGNSQSVIIGNLESKIINPIVEFLNKNEYEKIINIFDDIDNNFIADVFGNVKNRSNLLKKIFSMKDFYDWIFDDYYEVNYFIKYKEKLLEALSPGQKGLVLMKVFLKLDNSSKPLLIDQPEDNLDNKSVYYDLVEDIKEIKKKRQIIIATHNPNLVVNTDSEQVIVAKFEENSTEGVPRITYIGGSLENIKIRKLVCDILEGGDVAFMKREQRYSVLRSV